MELKIAHSVVVTPKRSGLYETTRELVASLRAAGVDSRMYDPTFETNQLHPSHPSLDVHEDRGAPFCDINWAGIADVVVNHSGLCKTLEEDPNLTVIHAAHGRPRYSFLGELKGGSPIYSYHYAKNKDPRFKALVTFWPLHVPYLEVMWPDTPVHCIPPMVDLDAWTDQGPRGYGFHGHKGSCNVVIADGFREDIDPFVVVNAFSLYAREHTGAKLHIYGTSSNKRGWAPLLKSIQDQGNLGEVLGWVDGLANVYRAADLLISPNIIATRTVREAMACGCPVLQADTVNIADFASRMQNARVQDRRDIREQAENRFAPSNSADAFMSVVDQVLNGSRQVATG